MKSILIIILFSSLFILLAPTCTLGMGATVPSDGVKNYPLNVPIGKLIDIDVKNKNILGEYIQTWYGFLIGIAGILATVMMIFAGVKWIASRGDAGAIGESKTMMISAVTGLALIFLSYSILALINPNLLTITMPKLSALNYTGKYVGDDSQRSLSSASRVPSGDNGGLNEVGNRYILDKANIDIWSSENCSDCTNPKCTCVGGTSEAAINNLLAIRQNCPKCELLVTGSTEAGHHYGCEGNCVDLQRTASLQAHIMENGTRVNDMTRIPNGGCNDATPCYQLNNTLYWFEDGIKEPGHIHSQTAMQ